MLAVAASVVGFFVVAVAGTIAYVTVASELPDPATLLEKQSKFASTKIYDRNDDLIVELIDPTTPNAGRRTYVKLAEISDWLKLATLATEDPNFYRYSVGFDPIALVRVVYYAVQNIDLDGIDIPSGGSTVTQQVARNLLLNSTERSVTRKFKEIILANELANRYPRDLILEIYVNEINYGNLAYGIEAASQTYFNKAARDLSLAEASLLAGLPQAPAYWDPVQHKDRALSRQDDVLRLMVKAGFISQTQADDAQKRSAAFAFNPRPVNVSALAPHFVNYARQQLSQEFDSQALYRDGLRVYTTIDRKAQDAAEKAVKDQLARLAGKHVNNAAVVVLDPATGELLAMVGSADYFSETIKGQFNVATALRQPGSSVKPFTYLANLEKGATPATLYWDLPKTYTNAHGQVYEPKNYDDKFHGAVLMRDALARSYNLPAVEALDHVGVAGFLETAQRLGVNVPPNPQYGLAVTLGGAEAKLIEVAGAYGVFAAGGIHAPITAISRVETADGRLIKDYRQAPRPQAISAEHAYLMTSMLSDNAARAPAFGANSVLRTAYPSAVKTGTTNDFRDNLTIGYTPEFAVGVWVGNTDNSAMKDVSGITGAAPIWRQVMDALTQGRPRRDFARPAGIVERPICLDGGQEPSPACPPERVKTELFKSDQLPLPPDERVEAAARAGDPSLIGGGLISSPDIVVTQPSGVVARGALVSVRGTVSPPAFDSYQVEYGAGDAPGDWRWISGPHRSPVVDGQLTEWGVPGDLPPGRYTVRVTAFTGNGTLIGYGRFDVP